MSTCPICGAPLQGEKCEYCGYVIPKQQEQQTEPSMQQPKQGFLGMIQSLINQQPQSQPQPQMNQYVVNNYYQQPASDISSKSRILAIIIWLFFGIFGGHQFYAGKTGMGLLYFFTVGLFGIGWMVDGASLFTGSFKDHEGKYLR